MRRILFSLVVLLNTSLAIAEEATTEATTEATKPWSVDLTTSFFSDYMWRGFNLYDGASIQPSFTGTYDTGYGEISGNLWLHLSAEGDRQAEKFFEMDETISYAYDFDPLKVTIGHVWYTYPDSDDQIVDSAEVFASLAFDDSKLNEFFSLAPKLTVYQDYRVTDSQYYGLGFSHAFESAALGEGFNITPYVELGFASNAEKVYSDSGGLVQVSYSVSSTLNLGDIEVIPCLNYTSKVDDATTNEFWFGAGLNYSF